MSTVSEPCGCPCGRQHRPQDRRARTAPGPRDHAEMTAEIYSAAAAGKVSQGERFGEWDVHYAGSCEAPMPIRRNSDKGALFATYWVRCRRCKPCLRAKAGYWTRHVVARTRETADAGLRTWFGTLTLRPEVQADLLARATEKWMASTTGTVIPEWWDDPKCDERFRFVRDELKHEIQKYWKRLRKAGHRFKYFLVFERHRSGLPHVHWLVHEETPIRKQDLQDQWSHGFTQVKLVGGYSRKHRRKLAPEFAAWYLTKYLSKSYQSRQLVSIRYAK